MLARYEQWLQQAFENQLLLCAYLHGKRVMPSACERIKTCRVRAFTLYPETSWRVTCLKACSWFCVEIPFFPNFP